MGQLIRLTTSSVELHGFAHIPKAARYVIAHYHGLAGNFYENPFVYSFIERADTSGFGFLSFNSRAHDYLADAVTTDRAEFEDRGAAHTSMSETVTDLGAWTDWLLANFDAPILLQAHSAGCSTLANYLSDTKSIDQRIRGASYLSPADMIQELKGDRSETKLEELRSRALELVQGGNGSELMPIDSLPGYPIDAAVFLEMSTPRGTWDRFPVDAPDRASTQLSRVPSLVVLGENDEALTREAGEVLEGFRRASSAVSVAMVPQAGHSYRGHESALVEAVVDWSGSVI